MADYVTNEMDWPNEQKLERRKKCSNTNSPKDFISSLTIEWVTISEAEPSVRYTDIEPEMNDLLHDAGCSLLSTLTNSALLDGLQKVNLEPTRWLDETMQES